MAIRLFESNNRIHIDTDAVMNEFEYSRYEKESLSDSEFYSFIYEKFEPYMVSFRNAKFLKIIDPVEVNKKQLLFCEKDLFIEFLKDRLIIETKLNIDLMNRIEKYEFHFRK